MRVVILLNYSFPDSTASANRYLSIAKALSFAGIDTEIISLQASHRKHLNQDMKASGIYEGIRYTNITGITYRPDNFFIRNLYKIVGKMRIFKLIFIKNREKKIDFVFVPSRTPILNCFMHKYFRLLKIRSLIESSEYPEIFLNGKFTGNMLYFLYKNIFLKNRFIDGMILMTFNLELYYRNITLRKVPSVVIPMSVDLERFDKIDESENESEKYIAYCGTLDNSKDGVGILIRSFASISEKHQDVRLMIIGGSSDRSQLEYYKSMAEELKVKNKIVFTGMVNRDDIPKILKVAIALVLSRPSSHQAQGGFPTKLGEYLASSRPVVVTNVGEISRYLENGVSAYIAEPDSFKDFSDKLNECLSDRTESAKIGLNGYSVAKKHFDYKINVLKPSDPFTKPYQP